MDVIDWVFSPILVPIHRLILAENASSEQQMALQVVGMLTALVVSYRIVAKIVGVLAFLLEMQPPYVQVEMNEEESRDVLEGYPKFHYKMLQDEMLKGDKAKVHLWDPSTMDYFGSIPSMTKKDVDEIVARSHVAQEQWKMSSFKTRRLLMRTMQRFISENIDNCARVAVRDSGKTMLDACVGEVLTTVEKLTWLANSGEQYLLPEHRDTGRMMIMKTARVEFDPLGVIAAIVPWNYPFHNVFNPVSAALFSGNSIVIKVSEYASWSIDYYKRVIDACLDAVNAPRDLVQFVVGYKEAGGALVEADVNKIIFVGSPEVGAIVARNASKNLTPVVLELGGKDPFVICDDADVKIWKVVVNGRENTEEDDILRALCKDRKAKDVTCMLVNTGSIDPNYTFEIKGMSSPLLQLTCAAGNVDFVRALLQAGADVDKTTNIDGTTALIVASQMGHALVVEALIQAGADVDKVDINGHTALSHASNSGYTSIVEALLQAGADIDKAANDGATALIFASSYDHAAAMEALLQAGADIDKADNDGTTALIWASKYGRAAIVEALIQAGADVDKTANDGYTALMVASVNGHTAIVEALLQASADVDNASNSGATALIVASGNGHAATVKALIQAGADVNKATEGTTAVTRALSRGHTAIVKLLLGAGATW